MKLFQLLAAPDRMDRIRLLWEVRSAGRVSDHHPATPGFSGLDDFVGAVERSGGALSGLGVVVGPGGEAEEALAEIRQRFRAFADDHHDLPFPAFYNADKTHALLSYGLVRHLRPAAVVETGVGYGVTTAMVLLALERNGAGHLTSIDLPPLAAASGEYTGILVPDELRWRWTIHLGSSRKYLRRVLDEIAAPDLFLSDSANVFVLERYELDTAWPHLTPGGFALFNNIPRQFQDYVASVPGAELMTVEQAEKAPMVTGLLRKPSEGG